MIASRLSKICGKLNFGNIHDIDKLLDQIQTNCLRRDTTAKNPFNISSADILGGPR